MTDALLARHSSADRVAFGRGGERTAADLLRDAAAVADALPEKVAERPIALLSGRDAYACVAALLGAWARGYEVLIPPADATREGFLRMAQRADVGAVLHDTASSAALPIARILESAAQERTMPDATCAQHGVLHFAPLEAADDQPLLRVTGVQLLREAALLGRSLALPEGASYACSLSASTRYAWAAGIFWPLLCGGSFLRDDPRTPAWAEEAERARRTGDPRNATVHAVPSQVADASELGSLAVELDLAPQPERASTHDSMRDAGWLEPDAAPGPAASTRESSRAAGWVERGATRAVPEARSQDAAGGRAVRAAQARVVVMGAPAQLRMLLRFSPQVFADGQWVVSLGAPLVAAGFQQLRAAGLVVSDVFATRQLGCVGVRDAEEDGFRPLLELSLRAAAEGVLLTAPHLPEQSRVQASLAADGGFFATGAEVQRAQWEERIAWMDGVQDAALLQLDASAQQGLHLALSLAGSAREERALKARVMNELPELELCEWRSLRRRDGAPLPVASFAAGRCDLSRNAAGRHDRASLLRLFGRAADGAPLSWDLRVEREQIEAARAVRYVRVPERYGYFTGHFPGYPLLPGAAQLSELVVPFVRAVRPELGRLTRMARLKFQERIVPNDQIEVSLSFLSASAEEQSVEFALKRGDSVCANGRLWFATAAPSGAGVSS